jgi:hypothetical protein
MFVVTEQHPRTAKLVFSLEDQFLRAWLGTTAQSQSLGRVWFWLVSHTANGVETRFDPPRLLHVSQNSSGFHIFFDQEQRKDGSRRNLQLTDGSYRIRLTSEFYQTLEQSIVVPGMDQLFKITLDPNTAYPFPATHPLRLEPTESCTDQRLQRRGLTLLRGSLHTPTGEGLSNAQVEATGSNIFKTDSTGQWVLWFPNDQPSGPLTVKITHSDGNLEEVQNVCVVQGRETSLNQTSLRGRVTRSGIGVSKAIVSISGQAEQGMTDQEGNWSFYFGWDQPAANLSITAKLPNGSPSPAFNVTVQPRTNVLVPTFNF